MSNPASSVFTQTDWEKAYELGVSNGMTIEYALLKSRMKSVFVIIDPANVCRGHGDYVDEPMLARKGWYGSDGYYPAFLTKEEAEKYIVGDKNGYRYKVVELKIQE